MNKVIRIRKRQIGARAVFHAQIPRRGYAAVFLRDHFDPGIALCVLFTDTPRSIGRAIVHQKDLQLPIGLVYYTVQTALQIFFLVVDWNDQADSLILFHVLFCPLVFILPRDRFSAEIVRCTVLCFVSAAGIFS